MTINVKDYWPPYFDNLPGKTYFVYEATGGVDQWWTSFEYSPDGMILKQYDKNGNWLNSWYLKADPVQGVLEVRDDLPQNNKWLKYLSDTVVERYSTPIGWGGVQEVGSVYYNSPTMNPATSWPPQFGKGDQWVTFEAVLDKFNGFSNVLQMVYQQAWDGKPAVGARMWMAKGIGPVANQWLSASVAGPIQLAKVSVV